MTGKEIVDSIFGKNTHDRSHSNSSFRDLAKAIDAALAAERDVVFVRKDDEGWWISLAADGKRASFNVGNPGPVVESVLVAICARRTP